jgi:hypothetical protein
MTDYRLALATEAECQTYAASQVSSGLPHHLLYLEKDPLALQERSKNQSFDHMHLSVPSTDSQLVQWWGRASSGYHYPVGRIMRILGEQ